MNELSLEKTMTVKEVAEILGVTPEAIKKHVRKLFPNLIQNGKTTYLNEYQVTNIKASMIPTTQVVGAITDLEKAETIQKAMMYIAEEVKSLRVQVESQKPAVDFYNAVTDSKDAIEMSKVAKMLDMGIGRNKLFTILRNNKILRYNNEPYQSYVDAGYFRIVEQKYTQYGETKISIKTLVYQKGLDYIRKILEKG